MYMGTEERNHSETVKAKNGATCKYNYFLSNYALSNTLFPVADLHYPDDGYSFRYSESHGVS